ncbi:hypothetical protein BU24DRAFT_284402 [Aaosphaeria arxii CBS 175.79]|uniref:Zn(2)-C6 fungal-type domain-containing protein n=1 Tax=Aaosphaeria arxii CBS 175.79 TaxID=1450172 RepID=A0A6A5XFD8_9PLEO|nr:uncharacterized protein BU24DRAFT_284402 [Aaosphaeria arxii CBS 175.79]KAF2011579.1 hypothetical protein BU24DRAFT_284402 [Aaosphaeria arxii CBS 175.79]
MSAVRSSRRWHSKSRTGCQGCKSRKVKCDEHRPSCRNCLKRATKCDFLDSEPPVPLSISGSQNLELELLHNFTVATAATLSTETQTRDMWRVAVPQIGFGTRYIMDCILSLSALHMARSDIKRRDLLLSQANVHLNASLKEALPLIPSVNKSNCDKLFLFSVLVLYINLASPRREEDMLVLESDKMPQWLFLLRGINPIVEPYEEALVSSSVSLIYRATESSYQFWFSHTPAEDLNLDDLEAGIRIRTQNDEAKQKVLIDTTQKMRRSYTFLHRLGDEARIRGFYTFLFEISDEYLTLLKNLDSDSLCIFAFFSVLIQDFEKYWWAKGWGKHLIKRIYFLLDEEYRIYIRWPIEQIGWVPPYTHS